MADYSFHEKPLSITDFQRLDMLWERYPQFHEKKVFSALDDLLNEHESYQKCNIFFVKIEE